MFFKKNSDETENNFLIKAINYEGLRKIGNPNEYAKKYYQEGIDEIIFIDIVASLYGRDCLFDIIKKAFAVSLNP